MKVIDLLVKIANGEEVSKKIKFMNSIWEYCKNGGIQDYINDYDKCLMEFIPINKVGLNDEVEIIEEPKKIEYPILHKTAPSETTGDQMPNWRNLIDCNFEYLNKTICQLIDEINNLKEND